MNKKRFLELAAKADEQETETAVVYEVIKPRLEDLLRRKGYDVTRSSSQSVIDSESRRIAIEIVTSGVDLADEAAVKELLRSHFKK